HDRVSVLRRSDAPRPRWTVQSTDVRDCLAGLSEDRRARSRGLAAVVAEAAAAAPRRSVRSVRCVRRPGALWIQSDRGAEAARLVRYAARHRLLVSPRWRRVAAVRPTRGVSGGGSAADLRERGESRRRSTAPAPARDRWTAPRGLPTDRPGAQ